MNDLYRAKMLIAGTTRYLCPVEEGVYIQHHDSPALEITDTQKFLYWPVVRPDLSN